MNSNHFIIDYLFQILVGFNYKKKNKKKIYFEKDYAKVFNHYLKTKK